MCHHIPVTKELLTIREQQFLAFLKKSRLRKKSEIARAMGLYRQRVQQLADRLIQKKHIPATYFEAGNGRGKGSK